MPASFPILVYASPTATIHSCNDFNTVLHSTPPHPKGIKYPDNVKLGRRQDPSLRAQNVREVRASSINLSIRRSFFYQARHSHMNHHSLSIN